MLHFADVDLDADARRVWRRGQPVHLTRKAFDLLLLLVGRRPSAVTKADIHQHLWPDTFVSESSLQALISEIRQAIGDDGRRQEIVRTIHGVGYAFTAATSEPTGVPAAGSAAAWLIGDLYRVPLQPGDNVLGRSGEGIVEIDDSTVSRRHARLHVGNALMLEDLGSKNGTFRGNEPVTKPVLLQDGDVIRLGSARFTFRLAQTAASTESVRGEGRLPHADQ